MFMKILAVACLLFFVWLAVRAKTRMRRGSPSFDLPTEPKESVFSRALAELIATAGGVYVSLLLLFSFLDMAVPGKIGIVGFQVDMLATVALVVAIIQPIIMGMFKKHIL